jgi:hypothetical protein
MNPKATIAACLKGMGLEKQNYLIDDLAIEIAPIIEQKIKSVVTPRLVKRVFGKTINQVKPQPEKQNDQS